MDEDVEFALLDLVDPAVLHLRAHEVVRFASNQGVDFMKLQAVASVLAESLKELRNRSFPLYPGEEISNPPSGEIASGLQSDRTPRGC